MVGRETKLNAGRKEAESERSHATSPETGTRTFPGKPHLHGNTKINKSGLI